MMDYRFLTYPALTGKMKDLIILSLIRQNISDEEIKRITAAQTKKVEDLKKWFLKGQQSLTKNTMLSVYKDEMKSADWAFAYGVHTRLNNKV